MTVPELRASSMNLLALCSAAYHECKEHGINMVTPLSRSGEAWHYVGQYMWQRQKSPNVEMTAKRFDVDQAEVDLAINSLWWIMTVNRDGIQVDSETPVRRPFGEFALTGTVDLKVVFKEKTIQIADLKSGWAEQIPPEHNYQLHSYIACMEFLFPEVERFVATIYEPKKGRSTDHEWNMNEVRDDLVPVLKDIGEKAIKNRSYNVGVHCANCPAKNHCRAYNQQIAAVFRVPEKRFAELTPSEKGEVLMKAKMAKSFIDEMIKQANVFVDANGPLPLPDGTQYVATAYNRRDIDSEKARPVIQTLLGDRWIDAYRLNQTALTRAAEAKFSAFTKEQVKKSINKKLESAGAITQVPTIKHIVKRGSK